MGPIYQNGVLPDSITEDEYLYDPEIVERLDFSKCSIKFSPPITPTRPVSGMRVRPLNTNDYDKGFVKLLNQLTEVGEVSREMFLTLNGAAILFSVNGPNVSREEENTHFTLTIERFSEMKRCPNSYYVTVIEDTDSMGDSIIGAATLVIEQKFIHGCAVRGRLEDVVVSNEYRGQQLGKLIVATIFMLAKELECYKITLDCKDKMIPFYESLGFSLEPGNSNYMTMRLPKSSL